MSCCSGASGTASSCTVTSNDLWCLECMTAPLIGGPDGIALCNSLGYASKYGHIDCVRAMLREWERGGCRDEKVCIGGAIHHAACEGRSEVLQLLLERTTHVNERNSHSRTPLLASAIAGEEECAIALLEVGASVTATDLAGHTPLHAAARKGLLGLVKKLLIHHADSDALTVDGATPARYCQAEWELNPGGHSYISAEKKAEVVQVLTRASRANELWRGRRLVVLLRARYTRGLLTVAPSATDEEDALRAITEWVVTRPEHEMTGLFRRIVLFL
ncbi:unnamed protein product [Chrysoparadoxa australica]